MNRDTGSEPLTNFKTACSAPRVTTASYQEAVDSFTGWCTECKEFTRDCTEPDAEAYSCPTCGKNSVVGAENALITGLFDIAEE